MPQSISIYITAKSIVLLLAAAALVWIIANFSGILVILFVAILLAVAITPLVTRLEELRIPRVIAIVISYVGLFAILSIVIAVMVPVLIEQIDQLSENLPTLTQTVLDLPNKWITPYFPSFAQRFQLNNLAQQLSDQLGAVVGGIGTLLVGVGRTLSSLILNG